MPITNAIEGVFDAVGAVEAVGVVDSVGTVVTGGRSGWRLLQDDGGIATAES